MRNFDELPRLPGGYPGCFMLAAIPPLWRKVMDPKVMRRAGGKLENANVMPGPSGFRPKHARCVGALARSTGTGCALLLADRLVGRETELLQSGPERL